ncbi:MAG: peroxiredoxin [Verrucomicrobiaceae bacterium]|nr:peroxiredoxin [Verrucomicrobiaceae bacterium]
MKYLLLTLTVIASAAFAEPGKLVNPPYDAPKITAPDHEGKDLNFADVYAKGITVVYFYPKADTPGCTKQSCSLRDASQDFGKLGVQVLGVSTDNPADQKAFKEKFSLPFTLIADEKAAVLDAFKVAKNKGGRATRQCFIVKDGKVVWHAPNASTETQADDVKAALKDLK